MRLPNEMTISEKIEVNSIPVPECGCWIWTAPLNSSGYGTVYKNNRQLLAHRASWMVANGDIPRGLYVLHRCDTPACVNPDHLFVGTQRDNVADCVAKGRHKNPRFVGDAHPSSRLTDEQVEAIKHSTKNQYVLAAEYGIAQSHVSNIKNGKRRKEAA